MEFISERVFENFQKGQILRPFSGPALSKLRIQKKLMVAYGHIEYSTYQISEKSKWGKNPPPPRSLRHRKKRGPERVNGPGPFLTKFNNHHNIIKKYV